MSALKSTETDLRIEGALVPYVGAQAATVAACLRPDVFRWRSGLRHIYISNDVVVRRTRTSVKSQFITIDVLFRHELCRIWNSADNGMSFVNERVFCGTVEPYMYVDCRYSCLLFAEFVYLLGTTQRLC